MSLRTALKHQFLSFSVKSASSIVFPVSIARAYEADVNGELQLLIAATSYLSLLDSGMTISAINSTVNSSVDLHSTVESRLKLQSQSSRKVLQIGILIATILLLWGFSSGFFGIFVVAWSSAFGDSVDIRDRFLSL